jgi:hypothetical protein
MSTGGVLTFMPYHAGRGCRSRRTSKKAARADGTILVKHFQGKDNSMGSSAAAYLGYDPSLASFARCV